MIEHSFFNICLQGVRVVFGLADNVLQFITHLLEGYVEMHELIPRGLEKLIQKTILLCISP